MSTMTPYRSTVPTGRDDVGRLLRAEWTKFRSVRRWLAGLIAAVLLMVAFSLLIAASSGADANSAGIVTGPDGEPVADDFHFVHQPLDGDGTITVQVRTQIGIDESGTERPAGEWAKAGVMIKESTEAGSPYAAVMVTPGHGVRMQSNFTTDTAGPIDTAPQWLRLTRTGTTIAGYASVDGDTWADVGTVELTDLPETAEVGMFVASPDEIEVQRDFGSTSVGGFSTISEATFADVSVDSDRSQPLGRWSNQDIGRAGMGDAVEDNGTFTVTGSGDIAPDPPDDDIVQISLTGAFVGLLAIVALGVLFATSEYKRGMVRTTFTASPRRGRVLAAKVAVIGAVTFAAGLVASVAAYFLAQPILRANGFAPPAFPLPSLADPPVLRAVVGTAAMLAVIAVLSVGVGTILRRSAGAITVVVVLIVFPVFVATTLPPSAAQWLMRLTPAGGFAIQRSKEPTEGLVEPWTMVGPWAGFGVLCAYAAVAVAVAYWLLRRRDA